MAARKAEQELERLRKELKALKQGALKRKEAEVLEAEQVLEGTKHWQEEAVKKVAAAEERLATMREERRKCAEQYQQAALESSNEVLEGPSLGVLASALRVAPKAADFLQAEEAQKVQ